MFRPIPRGASNQQHRNFRHLVCGRFLLRPLYGMPSQPARPIDQCRENLYPDEVAPVRTRTSRRRSQDRPAAGRRAQRLRAGREARRMSPGSVRSQDKNAAVAKRFNLATAETLLAGQLSDGCLFRYRETDQQHRGREPDVQISVGRVVRNQPEQHSVRSHEPEDGDDGIDDSE